jgi:hypothetical protein
MLFENQQRIIMEATKCNCRTCAETRSIQDKFDATKLAVNAAMTVAEISNWGAAASAPGAAIDWDKPLEVVRNGSTASPSPVRVLARGVVSVNEHQECTTLVAVTPSGRSDILIRVDPRTGVGYSVKFGVKYTFRNIEERQEVVSYANIYCNGRGTAGDVVEVFPSWKEANDQNLFGSRDCCVRLHVSKEPGKSWKIQSASICGEPTL